MRYLLDTNTCVAILRNRPQVISRISSVAPVDCGISTITIYELLTGVEKSKNPAVERGKVERLMQTLQQCPFDERAAEEAARIRARLESNGWPVRLLPRR